MNQQVDQIPAKTDATATPTPDNETPPTLDQVYEKFNIQPEQPPAAPAQPAVTQPTQPSPSVDLGNVPDPKADPEGFEKHQAQLTKNLSESLVATQQQLQELQKSNLEAQQQSEQQEASALASEIAKDIEGVSDKYVMYALAEKHKTDPKFRTLWKNRASNPGALAAASAALAVEIRNDLLPSKDPQVAADQEAFDKSTKNLTNKPSDSKSKEQEIMNMSDAEFGALWSSMTGGGGYY